MDKVILITDIDTPLGYSLARLYIQDGEKIIGTISSQNPELPFKELDKEMIDILEWHRTSAGGAKNLVLTIVNKYKKLDEALIVQSIEQSTIPLHNTAITDIEKEIDFWVKGLIFLAREIIKMFILRETGLLLFIHNRTSQQEGKSNVKQGVSPVHEAINSGIRRFIDLTVESNQKKGYKINSIESSFVEEQILSAYIYKNIKERLRQISGKKLRFQQKLNIFSGLKKS